MAVTSQLKPSPTFAEVWLSHWQRAGLIKPSAIKPVFATLEQALILKSLGALATEDRQALVAALQRITAEP